MDYNDYEITVKKNKNDCEVTVEIDMEKYGESFAENEFHLSQQYDEKTIKSILEEDKIEFLKDEVVRQNSGDIKVGKRELKKLMQEVDDDYNSYLEEIDSYSGDDED